jgi:hypothetical protein
MVSNCDEDDEMSSFLREVYGEELDIDHVIFLESEVVEPSDITLATIEREIELMDVAETVTLNDKVNRLDTRRS